MNSYNNVKKFKYEDPNKSVVSLQEYILFEDERKGDKYAMFKLNNNLDQELYEIHVRVNQFDENGELVGCSILRYSDFSAQPNETFVPNAKLRVQYSCKRIEASPVYARFKLVTWQNGEFTKVPYDLNAFRFESSEEKSAKNLSKKLKQTQREKQRALKELQAKEKRIYKEEHKKYHLKERDVSRKQLRKSFSVKSLYKRNKLKFANFIGTLFSIVIVVAVFLSAYLYCDNTLIASLSNAVGFKGVERVTNEGRIYQIGSDNNVILIDSGIRKGISTSVVLENFDSQALKHTDLNSFVARMSQYAKFILDKDTEITILPNSKFFDYSETVSYKIVEIGDNAFENCPKLTVVSIKELENDIRIGKYAFSGCSNLANITDLQVNDLRILSIGDYGFHSTGIVKYLSTKTTSIGEGAFSNCIALTNVNAPNAVIGKGCFAECNALSTVTVKSIPKTGTFGDLFGCENSALSRSMTVSINGMSISDFTSDYFAGLPTSVNVFINGDALPSSYRQVPAENN